MWHDVFGHLPLLLSSSVYRDFIENISIEIDRSSDPELKNTLANLFWYTVESGVCREGRKLKVYGASQLSSFKEISYALSEDVEVVQLEAVDIGTLSTNIHTIQSTIFEIPSFDYLAQIDFKVFNRCLVKQL